MAPGQIFTVKSDQNEQHITATQCVSARGKAVEDQYGFLCERLSDGEILQQSRVSASPHRGEKIPQPADAQTGGRRREEAIQRGKRGLDQYAGSPSNVIQQDPLQSI